MNCLLIILFLIILCFLIYLLSHHSIILAYHLWWIHWHRFSLTMHHHLNLFLLHLSDIIIMSRFGWYLCINWSHGCFLSHWLILGWKWIPLILFRWFPLHINITFILLDIEIATNMWIEMWSGSIVDWVCWNLCILRTLFHLFISNTSFHVNNAIIDIILIYGFCCHGSTYAAYFGITRTYSTSTCLFIHWCLNNRRIESITNTSSSIITVIRTTLWFNESLLSRWSWLYVIEWICVMNMMLIILFMRMNDRWLIHIIKYFTILSRLSYHSLWILFILWTNSILFIILNMHCNRNFQIPSIRHS